MTDGRESYKTTGVIDLGIIHGKWDVRTTYFNETVNGGIAQFITASTITPPDQYAKTQRKSFTLSPVFADNDARLMTGVTLTGSYGGRNVEDALALRLMPPEIRYRMADVLQEVSSGYGIEVPILIDLQLRGTIEPQVEMKATTPAYPFTVEPYDVDGWRVSGAVSSPGGQRLVPWVQATDLSTGKTFRIRPGEETWGRQAPEGPMNRKMKRFSSELIIAVQPSGESTFGNPMTAGAAVANVHEGIPTGVRIAIVEELRAITRLASGDRDIQPELEQRLRSPNVAELNAMLGAADASPPQDPPPTHRAAQPEPDAYSALEELHRLNNDRMRDHSLTFHHTTRAPHERGGDGGKGGPGRS